MVVSLVKGLALAMDKTMKGLMTMHWVLTVRVLTPPLFVFLLP
jgi:hypothetical protein